jgi:hypothetical protein
MGLSYARWAGVCLVILLVVAGCGQTAKAPEESAEVDTPPSSDAMAIEKDGGQITITTDEGTVTMSGGDGGGQMTITGLTDAMSSAMTQVQVGSDLSLPADFPSDVPMPNGMKIVSVSSLGEEGMYTVTGTVATGLGEAEAEIKKDAAGAGWKETTEIALNADMMRQFQAEKGDRLLNVVLTREAGETNVVVFVGRAE